MSNDPPESQFCNPEDVWAQLELEAQTQIVKQLSRLAYRFVVDEFKKSKKEKQDEIPMDEKEASEDSP
jgi:hypothetical protein